MLMLPKMVDFINIFVYYSQLHWRTQYSITENLYRIMKNFVAVVKLLPLLSAFTVLTILGCSSDASIPMIVNIDVAIQERNMTPSEILVKEDDTLILKIVSDESGTLHIHGYRVEQRIEKDGETKLKLDTGATGQFNIAFHVGGSDPSNGDHQHQNNEEEVEEVILGSLKVYPR